ncbi:hypothetical protein ERTO105960_01265 [Erysipelothrix tonsillarum]
MIKDILEQAQFNEDAVLVCTSQVDNYRYLVERFQSHIRGINTISQY